MLSSGLITLLIEGNYPSCVILHEMKNVKTGDDTEEVSDGRSGVFDQRLHDFKR